MIYLDYSATTKTDERVLESFIKANEYFGNPNSLHKLGTEAKELINASTDQIKKILNIPNHEIIYTSSASESNNLAIKGLEQCYKTNSQIITTKLEHSSINEPLNYLEKKGIKIIYVPLKNGLIDIEELEKLINDKTILVSIGVVNSETGIKQPIEQIGDILKKYPKVIFHSDITQAIGKIKIDLSNIDLASFSAHKFFGIKGIGCLIKKKNLNITPLIHGGKSTTIYRSGTPMTSLIVSMAKALRLIYETIDMDQKHIQKLNKKLRDNLKTYKQVYINSPEYAIPHILNISIIGVKPETFLHALEEDDIYISTQSACSKENISKSILAITNDHKKASSSIRISLSKNTTEKEIDTFLKSFNQKYNRLVVKK